MVKLESSHSSKSIDFNIYNEGLNLDDDGSIGSSENKEK